MSPALWVPPCMKRLNLMIFPFLLLFFSLSQAQIAVNPGQVVAFDIETNQNVFYQMSVPEQDPEIQHVQIEMILNADIDTVHACMKGGTLVTSYINWNSICDLNRINDGTYDDYAFLMNFDVTKYSTIYVTFHGIYGSNVEFYMNILRPVSLTSGERYTSYIILQYSRIFYIDIPDILKSSPIRVHFNTDTYSQFVYGDEYQLCAMLEDASNKVKAINPYDEFNPFDCIGGVFSVVSTGDKDIDIYSCGSELQPKRAYPQRVIIYARLQSGGNIGGIKMDFSILATRFQVELDDVNIPLYCYYENPFIEFMTQNWFVLLIVFAGLFLVSGIGYLYYRNHNKELNLVASNLSGKNNEAVELASSAFDMSSDESITPSFVQNGSQYPSNQYQSSQYPSSQSPRSHSPKRTQSRSPSRRGSGRRQSPQRMNQINPYSSSEQASPAWNSGGNMSSSGRSKSRSPKRSGSRSPGRY